MSCCRLNLPSQAHLHWCLTLKVLVLRGGRGGGREEEKEKMRRGKRKRERKRRRRQDEEEQGQKGEGKKEKNFQLVQANVNTRFYTSTVSRRGQPTGRSNSAEVMTPLHVSLSHVSTGVHVTRMHVHTSVQRNSTLVSSSFFERLLEGARVCVSE